MEQSKEGLLTVAEFAKAAGRSRQAVYQQIDKSLQPYVKVIDGRKFLRSQALEIYGGGSECQSVDQESKSIDKRESDVIQELRDRIIQLERDKDRLYSLLEEKEKSLQQAQALHLTTQTGTLLEEDTRKEKKGIFAKLFTR